MEYNDLLNLIFENIRKIIFPEEWLQIDLALSKQEVLALMILDKHNEIIMSQLAEFVNMPMSTATGIVDRLVKNGYIERERNDLDRRIVVIKLTAKGKTLVTTIKDVSTDYLKRIFAVLTDEEQQFLLRIVSKIMGIINAKGSGKGTEAKTGEGTNQLKKISIE